MITTQEKFDENYFSKTEYQTTPINVLQIWNTFKKSDDNALYHYF